MRSFIRPAIVGAAAFAFTLTGLSLIPVPQGLSTSEESGAQSLLDLLNPALIARSLCGEQGKKRGVFFRPELLMALSPSAWAEEVEPEVAAEDDPPLYEGMGEHNFKITTRSDKAQAYFNQGIALTFGFNHWEAIRAFRKAQELDPTCAMCYWAEAFALGPNINDPMADDRLDPAFSAMSKSVMLKDHASKKERRLIDALTKRYSLDPDAKREDLDKAFSDAMAKVHAKHKKDNHIASFYAESLMDLSPWDYWERDFQTPKPHIVTAIDLIETVLDRNPDHAGAIHLYIHLMEPSTMPEKAAPGADRLAALVPGSGHLVHMPGHTYFRIGRYLDSLTTNVEAVKVDEAYLASVDGSDLYRYGYYPHNVHFVLVSAQMAGDGDTTLKFSEKLDKLIPISAVETAPFVQPIKASPMFAYLQYGDSDMVQGIGMPPETLPYLKAMWHYVRGVDFAWNGKVAEAKVEADAILVLSEGVDFDDYGAGNPVKELFLLANHLVHARIDQKNSAYDSALVHTQKAVQLQSMLEYTEPPLWYYPVEQTLGALYLQKGEPEKAVGAFRASLIRHPNNAWSLYGMLKAQEAAGDTALPITQQLYDGAAAVKEDIPLEKL